MSVGLISLHDSIHISVDVLHNKKLDSNAKLLYGVLYKLLCNNIEGKILPKKELLLASGLDKNEIQPALSKLTTEKLLKCQKSKDNLAVTFINVKQPNQLTFSNKKTETEATKKTETKEDEYILTGGIFKGQPISILLDNEKQLNWYMNDCVKDKEVVKQWYDKIPKLNNKQLDVLFQATVSPYKGYSDIKKLTEMLVKDFNKIFKEKKLKESDIAYLKTRTKEFLYKLKTPNKEESE
jgi:hypothetical protein